MKHDHKILNSTAQTVAMFSASTYIKLFTMWEDHKQVVGRYKCSTQTPPFPHPYKRAYREQNVLRTGCIHHEENKWTDQVRALVASQRCYLWSSSLLTRLFFYLSSPWNQAEKQAEGAGCAKSNCNLEFLPLSFFPKEIMSVHILMWLSVICEKCPVWLTVYYFSLKSE